MRMWAVEYTDQFDAWYQTLSAQDQDAIIGRVVLLKNRAPGSADRQSTTFTNLVIRT
jgi:hypothetical protein